MNSFSAISIHNCWARRGVAARAATAEKLVYHLNKKQSLGDQSAISTNSVAEFSLAGKAGCWKGAAPAFELIIPGRIDRWLDAHIIKHPAHLLNLDIYMGINSSGLPCMREKTHRDLSQKYPCEIPILTLQSKMVASCFNIHFKAVKKLVFQHLSYTHIFFHLRGMKSSSHLFFQLCCITIFKLLCRVCHAIQQLIKLHYIVLCP